MQSIYLFKMKYMPTHDHKCTKSHYSFKCRQITYPIYLYMMKPKMHMQRSTYFRLWTFLILKTTIDSVKSSPTDTDKSPATSER